MQYRADIQQSYKSRDMEPKAKEQKRKTLHGSMKETGSSGSFGISSHSVSHGFIQVLSVMFVTQTAVVILLFGTEVEAVTLHHHHHHPHWFAVTPMGHLMLDICTETQRLHRKHSNRDLKPANMSRDTLVYPRSYSTCLLPSDFWSSRLLLLFTI